MAMTTEIAYEDAWGEDEDDGANVCAKPAARCRSGAVRDLYAQQRLHSSRDVSSSGRDSQTCAYGAYTLQAYCLGCLGPYAEALTSHGEEVLPFLPPEAKSALIAIARRQGILTDQALKLLVDSTWTSLDLSFSTVSNASLQEALQSLPNLLVLDISGCKFQPRTLQMLGKHCPQLQILRLGQTGYASDDDLASAIKQLMPRVTNPAAARDSWEALLPNSTAASRASLTQCTVHCLSHLTYLVWPSIPIKTAGMLARKFPKVIVNPTPGSCPAAADISIALDEPTIQSVAPFWQIEEEFEEPVQLKPIVPLSERFRLAYVSRAERVAAKAERNYQQKRRRELRNNTVLQALAKFNYL